MVTLYAKFMNQSKFKCHFLFSASFCKINEKDQRSDKTETFINLNVNHKITETDINNTDVKSQLEHQTQIQQTKESGWTFDKNKSKKKRFYKTGVSNGSNNVKFLFGSNAILKIENDDNYCFFWSILVVLHLRNNGHLNRVSNYRQYFNDLTIEGFDFSNGFKSRNVHKVEKLNNLSLNIFELSFFQDQNKW